MRNVYYILFFPLYLFAEETDMASKAPVITEMLKSGQGSITKSCATMAIPKRNKNMGNNCGKLDDMIERAQTASSTGTLCVHFKFDSIIENPEIIQLSVKNVDVYGKKSCRCCDATEKCFSTGEGFSALSSNLKAIGKTAGQMALIGTFFGAIRGHRKICEIMRNIQGGLGALNLAIGTMCAQKASTCSGNVDSCSQKLTELEMEVENIITKLNEIYNHDINLPVPVQQELCINEKIKYENFLSSYGKFRNQLDETSKYCQDIGESANLLMGSAGLFGAASMVSHACSEKQGDNPCDHTKGPLPAECRETFCFIDSSTPECQEKCKESNPPIWCPSTRIDCYSPENYEHKTCQAQCTKYSFLPFCKGESPVSEDCTTNPNHPNCLIGPPTDDDDDGDIDKLSLETPNDNGDNLVEKSQGGEGGDDGDYQFYRPPTLPQVKAPQPKYSGPTRFSGGGSGGGSAGGGGLSGGGGFSGGSGEEGEDSEERLEEGDPYKDLLKGLAGGKQNQLTGGGGNIFPRRESTSSSRKPGLNLKKFLPKSKKKGKRSLGSLSSFSIFDINSQMLKTHFCDKYSGINCIQTAK